MGLIFTPGNKENNAETNRKLWCRVRVNNIVLVKTDNLQQIHQETCDHTATRE